MWRKSKIMGISVAASWAWGTSLIVGQQIAQQRGLGAWLMWAVANTLTLVLFGWLYSTKRIPRAIYDMRSVKAFGAVVQAFCLIIQLNIIRNILIDIGMDGILAYGVSTFVGLAAMVWMAVRGLRGSVLTDVVQWGVLSTCVVLIVIGGFIGGVPRVVFPSTSTGDALWGLWSAVVLLSAPIGDVQHWQRAKAMDGRAYIVGAGWFGLYMLGVLAMACFEFNGAMNALLLVAVLCVTTSTMDSVAVALHDIAGRRVGLSIGAMICVLWGVLADIGVVELWSRFGVFRVGFAVLVLVISYKWRKRNGDKED